MLTLLSSQMRPRDPKLGVALRAALAESGVSQKAAAIDMGLSEGELSLQLSEGSCALWRLLRVQSARFQFALCAWLAARGGWVVVTREDAAWLRVVTDLRRAVALTEPPAHPEEGVS